MVSELRADLSAHQPQLPQHGEEPLAVGAEKRLGRIEARHRWKAALDAGPTPERKGTLEAKYDYGLDLALRDTAKK